MQEASIKLADGEVQAEPECIGEEDNGPYLTTGSRANAGMANWP